MLLMIEPSKTSAAESDISPLRATSRSLPIALLRAREKVMAPLREMLEGANVTEQQWRVLRVLQESGPLVPGDLARRACLLTPSLTRIMRTLETKGLIDRRHDEVDRRKQLVWITKAGAGLLAANAARTADIFVRIEAAFGAERMEHLLDLLNELDSIEF